MTYAELVASVALWLKRDDLTATAVPTFIELTTARLNRELRTRQMVGRATLSVTSSLTALPADFLKAKGATVGVNRLAYVTEDQMLLVASDGGEPRYFTLIGSSMQVAPVPGAATDVVLTYYKKLPDLSDTQSNWALEQYPDLYLYGALAEAGQFLVDDGLTAKSEARYQAAKRAAEKASVESSGDRLTPSFDQIV